MVMMVFVVSGWWAVIVVVVVAAVEAFLEYGWVNNRSKAEFAYLAN